MRQDIGANGRMKGQRNANNANLHNDRHHVHTFGPLTYDSTSGMHVKMCLCGFTRKFEVM